MRKTILSTLLLSSVLTLSSPVVFAAPAEPQNTEVQTATQQSLISLNTATVEQLMSLPGIGRKKAEAIVQFRDDVGGFKTLDELKDVRGIGDKLFARVSGLVSL